MRIGITTNRKKHKVPFSCAGSYKFHVTVNYIEVYGSFHFVELNLAHDCRVLLFFSEVALQWRYILWIECAYVTPWPPGFFNYDLLSKVSIVMFSLSSASSFLIFSTEIPVKARKYSNINLSEQHIFHKIQ